jgi:hypothetical protein
MADKIVQLFVDGELVVDEIVQHVEIVNTIARDWSNNQTRGSAEFVCRVGRVQ